jgi:hypothetical protein
MHRRDCHGVGTRGECRSGAGPGQLKRSRPLSAVHDEHPRHCLCGQPGFFFWRYYRRRLLAVLTLALTFGSLIIVVPPLGINMDNLLVRNQVHRSLTVESRALLPVDHNARFTNLSVRIMQSAVFVRGDIVASPGLFTQGLINVLRDKLSKMVKMPVILEFGIIPETILRSTEAASSDG